MIKVLCHLTSREAANSILQNGFHNPEIEDNTDTEVCGCWFSTNPDSVGGAASEAARLLVEIDLTEAEWKKYLRAGAWGEFERCDPETGDIIDEPEDEPEPFEWYIIPAEILKTNMSECFLLTKELRDTYLYKFVRTTADEYMEQYKILRERSPNVS